MVDNRKTVNRNLIFEKTLLEAVNTTGSSQVIDVSDFSKITFHMTATGVSSGADLELQSSLDKTNFVTINESTKAITSSGTTEFAITNKKYKYIKANITSRNDGVYSVLFLAGN